MADERRTMEQSKEILKQKGVEILADLGTGLFVALVPVNEFREQDINARIMDDSKFKRLVANIEKRGTLESLPYCTLTDRGIEIVSGHHRIKASRAAGIEKVPTLIDLSNLSRSQIAAKQIAHNALAGVDDENTLKEIAKLITDVDDMLESALDNDFFKEQETKIEKLSTIAVDIEWKTVEFLFLNHQIEDLNKLVDNVTPADTAGVASIEQFKPFVDALEKVKKFNNVKAVGTAINMMIKAALESIGETPVGEEKMDCVTIGSIIGQSAIPKESAATIKAAFDDLIKKGVIEKKQEWRALEMWAAEYLAEK